MHALSVLGSSLRHALGLTRMVLYCEYQRTKHCRRTSGTVQLNRGVREQRGVQLHFRRARPERRDLTSDELEELRQCLEARDEGAYDS